MVNLSAPAVEGFEDQFPGQYSWDGYNGSQPVCEFIGGACNMESILDIVGYDAASINALTDESLLEMLNSPNATDAVDELADIIGVLSIEYTYNIYSGIITLILILKIQRQSTVSIQINQPYLLCVFSDHITVHGNCYHIMCFM